MGRGAMILTRSDTACNMARYYRLEILDDLLGGVVLERTWGRIGSHGQQRRHWFATRAEAKALLDALARTKRRRGYE